MATLTEWVFFGLSVNVLGSINLPAHPHISVFSACDPAKVTSSISGVGDVNGTSTQFTLNLPQQAGKFCTTWDFSDGLWTYAGGTFTVSTVPEPGTICLMGSGMVALLVAVSTRKRLRLRL
jgi:PEP-CTERM motif